LSARRCSGHLVVSKDVPYALLAGIAEQPEETLRRGLAHLQEAEFLYETQLFPDLEHTFKHALTHEVTYGSLLSDRRKALHAQIVAAIERLYADRVSEQMERLAQHALRGHLWDKAVRYSRQAGTRALEPLGRPGGPRPLRAGPGRAAGTSRAGSGPRAAAHLWSGRAADAVPLLEEAVEAVTAGRILGLRSWIITSLAEAYLVLGRIAEARERAEQAVALARAHQQQGWEAWGLKRLGDVYSHEPTEFDQSGVDQAGDAYRQALALATELGMRPLVAHCHLGLAKLHARTGQREQVREHLATATTLYREMDMHFWLEQADTVLGPSHGNPP